MGPASDRSDGTVRLAFILYYDDLEVVNPLGAFHGTHKLGMFYWALVNVERSERMSFHNLHLMTVALVSDIDYYGIEQVISGLPGDESFGSAMTALDSGVDVRLANGSTERMRGWCICLSADYPAAALCCGFKKSVSAGSFCRECYVNKHDEDYPTATSFLEDNGDLECECCLYQRQSCIRHARTHPVTCHAPARYTSWAPSSERGLLSVSPCIAYVCLQETQSPEIASREIESRLHRTRYRQVLRR